MTGPSHSMAPLGHRFINALIDTTAFLILWALVIVAVSLAFNTWWPWTAQQFLLAEAILLLPTFWGYYILTEYRFQRTLGKLATGTKVVSLTGHKPSLKQIVLRTLSRSIPFEYVSYFVSVEGLHDRLSKTRVVLVQSQAQK